MSSTLIAAAFLIADAPAASDPPGFEVSITMQADELRLYRTNTFTVSVSVDAAQAERYGWNLPEPDDSIDRGHPILQIEVPDGVELISAPAENLATPEDFVVFFLDLPYGRRLLTAETTIPFRLTRVPMPDTAINVNIVAYLGSGEKGDAEFVRTRHELPLVAGAAARAVAKADSRWGRIDLITVGAPADDFELPNTSRETVTLCDFAGRDIILTTYRGMW